MASDPSAACDCPTCTEAAARPGMAQVTHVESAATTGSWVVCIRDLPSNTDEYLGYFRSEDRADALARRLRRDVEAVGADHIIDVNVCWVRPEPEYEDSRDELLAELKEMGYAV